VKKALSLILLCLFAVTFFFHAQSASAEGDASPALIEKTFRAPYEIFGTFISATLYGTDEQDLKDAWSEALDMFDEVEFSASANIPGSDIYEFNELASGKSIATAGPHTTYLLNKAQEYYAATNGAFNPCAYLLNDLWQLSPRFNTGFTRKYDYDRTSQKLPDQKYVSAFRGLMDFSKVAVNEDDGTITKAAEPVHVDGKPYHMKIDLGAIAKGYASDLAKDIFESYGITHGRLSLGNSSLILLENPDPQKSTWDAGLLAPDYNGVYVSMKINGALSTSGDYQNYYRISNTRYCHIMDTKAGAPIRTNIRTASVYGGGITGMEADALSTAIMAMDFSSARAFVNSKAIVDRGVKVIFVYEKNWALGSVFEVVTNAVKSEIKIRNADYRLTGLTNKNGSFVYNPLRPDLWFWLVASTISVAVVVCAIFLVLRKFKFAAPQKTTSALLKQQKFFLKKDLFVYSFLAALIVILLVVFVFAPNPETVKELQIHHRNVLIYRYDFETQQGEITAADFEDKIATTTANDKTQIKIEIDGHYNTITIDKNKAKVTAADCSLKKDCVNAFPAISKAGQVVICSPHHLKITGVGTSGTDLFING